MANRLLELLGSRPWLLADGAIGTNLFGAGLQSGDAPELWNLEHPGRIEALHREFLAAGADILLTNSFGAGHYRLVLHRAEGRMGEINRAAARIARRAAETAGRPVVVAGSMGPTGELLAPLGALEREAVREAFAAQAAALAEGGVDVLWLETFSAREELEAAYAGAAGTGLPVVFTLSFDTNGRTMMGVRPADLGALAGGLSPPPAAVGTNCGVGAAEVVAAVLNASRSAPPGSVLVAKANCGIPYFVDGAIRYDGTPELMAEYARLVRDAGARIVGGCCGTTAEHLAAMQAALLEHPAAAAPDLDTVVSRLGPVSNGARAAWSGTPDPLAGAAARAPRGGRRRGRHGGGTPP